MGLLDQRERNNSNVIKSGSIDLNPQPSDKNKSEVPPPRSTVKQLISRKTSLPRPHCRSTCESGSKNQSTYKNSQSNQYIT